MAADWSVVSGVATAVGTFLLALFACWAWRASRQTLAVMKRQSDDDLAQRQSAREIDALADYLRDLNTVSNMRHYLPVDDPGDDALEKTFKEHDIFRDYIQRSIISPVLSSGAIWRLQHHRNESQLEKFIGAEKELISSLWKLTAMENAQRWRAVSTVLPWFLDQFTQLLRDWQLHESRRAELSDLVEESANRLEDSIDDLVTELVFANHAAENGPPDTTANH